MKKRVNNIKVIKDPINPETPEILAASIIAISNAMKKLCGSGGLTPLAIVQLVKGLPKCSQLAKEDIILVLEGLDRLSSYYIRK